MFRELRPATGEVATTPEAWGGHFGPASFTFRERLSIRLDSRWRHIRRYIRRGRVLDAGCGRGEWVEFLCRRGYQAEGLDYSPELIARLKAAFPQRRWTHGSTQALPYDHATFDGLVSWGVIEHDPSGPLRQLQEFRRVLKPGGRAIVTVPYDSEPMRRSSALAFSGGKFFQFFFTPEEFAQVATEAGFRVLEAAPVREGSAALIAPEFYVRAPGHPIIRALNVGLRMMPFLPAPAGMIYAVCEVS